jgi:hypothetical protein
MRTINNIYNDLIFLLIYNTLIYQCYYFLSMYYKIFSGLSKMIWWPEFGIILKDILFGHLVYGSNNFSAVYFYIQSLSP